MTAVADLLISARFYLNLLCSLLLLTGLAFQHVARAQPKPPLGSRYVTEGNVNFVLIGNTLAQDVASGVPGPVSGIIGAAGTNTDDSAPDIYWRSDSPVNGQAEANTSILPAAARTTAILTLPIGAVVRKAYIYWGAIRASTDLGLTSTAELRVGSSASYSLTAESISNSGNNAYQAEVDVTSIVQVNGAAAYTISNLSQPGDLVNVDNSNQFAGWAMVVIYEQASQPYRKIELRDGVFFLDGGIFLQFANLTSTTGSVSLGIVAYEGDNTETGEVLKINDSVFSDGLNPANNVFNSTHSSNGSALSSTGDLPQLTGTAGSMSGIDLDILNVTNFVPVGSSSYSVDMYSGNDKVHIGVLISAAEVKPSGALTTQAIPSTVCAGSSVALSVTVTGGSAPYSYSWSAPAGSYLLSNNTSEVTATTSLTTTGPQNFTVKVADATSTVMTAVVTVQVNGLPAAKLVSQGVLSCTSQSVTLTAGGGSLYAFSGPGIIQADVQSGTALATIAGPYSVTVTNSLGCSAITSTTVESYTALVTPTLQASAMSTLNQPISVTANGSLGILNWIPQGGIGSASGSVYTFSTPGNYTLSVSYTIGSCTSPVSTPVSLAILPTTPNFTISTVNLISCQPTNNGQRLIQLNPVYNGLTGERVILAIAYDNFITDQPGPYTLQVPTDQTILTLIAQQGGNTATFNFRWLEACNVGSTNLPPNTTGIPSQTALKGQAYQLSLTTYFADPEGQSLSFQTSALPSGLSLTGVLISGISLESGSFPISVTAVDPTGLFVTASFQLTVNGDSSPFALVGVNTLGCQTLGGTLRKLTFIPQYTGLTGEQIILAMTNGYITTQVGPYTQILSTAQPLLTLIAQQGGNTATFNYNWLAICNDGSRQSAREDIGTLQVKILGNPVEGQTLEVEITGVEDQRVNVNLIDFKGHRLLEHWIGHARVQERVKLEADSLPSQFILQVSTATQQQVIKLLKP